MTQAERTLLKMLAGWVVEQENKIAEELGTTSNLSSEVLRLLKVIQEQQPQ
jgi:hypothetical protein